MERPQRKQLKEIRASPSCRCPRTGAPSSLAHYPVCRPTGTEQKPGVGIQRCGVVVERSEQRANGTPFAWKAAA
jgi:hypothetical protein